MKPKVSDATAAVLAQMHYLSEVVDKDLINYSSLARYVHPLVEKKLGRKTSYAAVFVACKNLLTKKIFNIPRLCLPPFFRSSKLYLKSDLVLVHFSYSAKLFNKLAAMHADALKAGNDFIMLVGQEELSVMVSSELLPSLLECDKPLEVCPAAALITIAHPKNSFSQGYGGLAYLASQFASVGVTILAVFSSASQTYFLVSEKDVPAVFAKLSSAFDSFKQPHTPEP